MSTVYYPDEILNAIDMAFKLYTGNPYKSKRKGYKLIFHRGYSFSDVENKMSAKDLVFIESNLHIWGYRLEQELNYSVDTYKLRREFECTCIFAYFWIFVPSTVNYMEEFI